MLFPPVPDGRAGEFLASILNSDAAKEFYNAFIFWDAKRPITADILKRLDLLKLAKQFRPREDLDWLAKWAIPKARAARKVKSPAMAEPSLWSI